VIVLTHVYNGYICLLRSHQINWLRPLFYQFYVSVFLHAFALISLKFVVSRYVVRTTYPLLIRTSQWICLIQVLCRIHITLTVLSVTLTEKDIPVELQSSSSSTCSCWYRWTEAVIVIRVHGAVLLKASSFQYLPYSYDFTRYHVCTLCGYIWTLNLHCIIVISAADCLLLCTVPHVELFCIVFRYSLFVSIVGWLSIYFAITCILSFLTIFFLTWCVVVLNTVTLWDVVSVRRSFQHAALCCDRGRGCISRNIFHCILYQCLPMMCVRAVIVLRLMCFNWCVQSSA